MTHTPEQIQAAKVVARAHMHTVEEWLNAQCVLRPSKIFSETYPKCAAGILADELEKAEKALQVVKDKIMLQNAYCEAEDNRSDNMAELVIKLRKELKEHREQLVAVTRERDELQNWKDARLEEEGNKDLP